MPGQAMASSAWRCSTARSTGAKGDLERGGRQFRIADALEHSLPYTEPPWWHQPVSHLLGAALLAGHQPAEAEAVYRDSLKTYRGDGWALFGLAQALDAQGKTAEAAQARGSSRTPGPRADVKLTSSRSPS